MDVLETMYRNEVDSLSQQPQRVITRIDDDSIILSMPGYSKILERFVLKIVSEYRKNPEKFGRMVQGGALILIDAKTSETLALIDSTALTAVRTGALSGLATKLLSRKDSKNVGVIGSGQQAKALLEAVCTARSIEKAHVYSREYSHAKQFSKDMSLRLNIPIEPIEEKREFKSLREDILIVATNSSVPVLSWDEDVSPGMHINSIGTLPERQELDLDTIRNSRLFVDLEDGVLKEAGDVMYAMRTRLINQNHIQGNLADLILGKTIGRKSPREVTLFKSVGFALLDVYAANAVYESVMRSKQ
jgi:alanine dehydrogenase